MDSAGNIGAVSDKNKKENFKPLDLKKVLEKIDQLPVSEWNYKDQDDSIRHIGPMAQDFHKLFQLNGSDDTRISSLDPTGVSLAGIKGLIEKTDGQQDEIDKLKAEIDSLKKTIEDLKKAE